MSFNNNGINSVSISIPVFNISAPASNVVSPKAIPSKLVPQKNLGLNAPMIGRVYKAKTGCSACGKKVS